MRNAPKLYATTLMVTIVHPAEGAPESVAESLYERALEVAESFSAGCGTVSFSSVEAAALFGDNPHDSNDWSPGWYSTAKD